MRTKTANLDLRSAQAMYGANHIVDRVLLKRFTKEELENSDLPKSWFELRKVSGYIPTSASRAKAVKGRATSMDTKMTFIDMDYFNRAMTEAMLVQLIKEYNNDVSIDFSDGEEKFSIVCYASKNSEGYPFGVCSVAANRRFINPLSFHNREVAVNFVKQFYDLIADYFMVQYITIDE